MLAPNAPAAPAGLIQTGRFFFKHRNLLFPLVALPLMLGTPTHVLLGDARADHALQLLGVLVVVSGQSLRALVIGVARIGRAGKHKQIHARQLFQAGLFAHSRNPLYFGNLLILAGLALIHGGVWMYACFLPFFVFVYAAIVAAEECYLSGEFGPEYAEYCQRVPRFVPRARGLLATVRGMGFDWRCLVRSEYGTIFLSLTSVIVVLAWKHASAPGFESSRQLWQPLAVLWSASFVAYLVTRALKRRGALGIG
jgi:protein-S-isoprenylcysteine O-methyltransferase Ste14